LVDIALGNRLIELRARIVSGFDAGNWEDVGLLTGASDTINNHPRLLRSLSWGDEDYAGNVLTVVRRLVEQDPRTLPIIESYVDKHFPGEGTYISAKPSERRITFAPYVFAVPDTTVELDLVSVMMPFSAEFTGTYEAIKRAADTARVRCLRADDIWEDSTIVQDIFNLIFRSQVVVVDFTGRNPNVMYETGIAHTLGKHVIPISQSLDDVPFDMRHHRVLKYLSNKEGLSKLAEDLARKLSQVSVGLADSSPTAAPEQSVADDDLPF
jgi:AbiJ-like protein